MDVQDKKRENAEATIFGVIMLILAVILGQVYS